MNLIRMRSRSASDRSEQPGWMNWSASEWRRSSGCWLTPRRASKTRSRKRERAWVWPAGPRECRESARPRGWAENSGMPLTRGFLKPNVKILLITFRVFWALGRTGRCPFWKSFRNISREKPLWEAQSKTLRWRMKKRIKPSTRQDSNSQLLIMRSVICAALRLLNNVKRNFGLIWGLGKRSWRRKVPLIMDKPKRMDHRVLVVPPLPC